jgi:hypothetical protein
VPTSQKRLAIRVVSDAIPRVVPKIGASPTKITPDHTRRQVTEPVLDDAIIRAGGGDADVERPCPRSFESVLNELGATRDKGRQVNLVVPEHVFDIADGKQWFRDSVGIDAEGKEGARSGVVMPGDKVVLHFTPSAFTQIHADLRPESRRANAADNVALDLELKPRD